MTLTYKISVLIDLGYLTTEWEHVYSSRCNYHILSGNAVKSTSTCFHDAGCGTCKRIFMQNIGFTGESDNISTLFYLTTVVSTFPSHHF